jgi:hypothetical protein
MNMNEHERCRRRLLTRAAVTLPLLTTLSFLTRSGPAFAGKAPKSDFHYQDHPNDGNQCSNCVAFTPPPSGDAYGACSIIAGPISPKGWCMAFSSK